MSKKADFLKIKSSDRGDYRDLISPVGDAVWPEFMFHDPIANQHWDGLFERFPGSQFAFLQRDPEAVAAIANSAPLRWDGSLDDLPDAGWDWALIQSAADDEAGRKPNVLCGLQISISPDFQGTGLSGMVLDEMLVFAREGSYSRVIIPVRPSLKARYPLTSMEAYIRWKTEAGLPFDPWLRVHARRGGRIVKTCPEAMRIPGTVSEWEGWTGLRFLESGDYIVPGALSPVRFDVEADTGLYLEPNVWVVHEIAANPLDSQAA